MAISKFETNSKQNLFFKETIVKSKEYNSKLENKIINIYPNKKCQSFIGFGAAITDSAGYSFNKLSSKKQEDFIEDCFGENGLNYNFCRLPIGSSDFSPYSYSYSNKKDLSDFSIEENKNFTFNLLHQALEKNKDIRFLSSPWSPPKFMKNTKMLVLGGKLKDEYKQTYADYLSKYILEYKKEGITIEYITVQNEPNAIQIWESCLYSSKEEADFAINYLYPTFKKNEIETKILVWDHNKEKLYSRAIKEMEIQGANEAISGFAFHWYTGNHFENIELTANDFKDKLLIHTEGCVGYSKFSKETEVSIAEAYAHDILEDLNAGTNGYIDWNILLDNKGGPNHKKNYCDSPIMLNKEETDYIKNLSYYYIKHFSNLIKPGAKRLSKSSYESHINVTAFENPNGEIVVVLLNRTDTNYEYNLCIDNTLLHDNLDSHAIVSYRISK